MDADIAPRTPPSGDDFKAWLLTNSPWSLDDQAHLALQLSITWGFVDNARSLNVRLSCPPNTLARIELPDLGVWLKEFPETGTFAADAACIAVLARWTREIDPEELIGADDSRMFLIWGFDWQDPASIFGIGTADGSGWSNW